MDEAQLLREELAIRDQQIAELKGWMRKCDHVDELEFEIKEKDKEITTLGDKITFLKQKLEKTTLQRDQYLVHTESLQDRIMCMQEFIASEEIMHRQEYNEKFDRELELMNKVRDVEALYTKLRASQGRPASDHRDAPTFRDQLEALQKEHGDLKKKHGFLVGSHATAMLTIREYDVDNERRKSTEAEEKQIRERIQKNLGGKEEKTTGKNMSTQTFYSEPTVDDTVKQLERELTQAKHENDILSTKYQHSAATTASLTKRSEMRKAITATFRKLMKKELTRNNELQKEKDELYEQMQDLRNKKRRRL